MLFPSFLMRCYLTVILVFAYGMSGAQVPLQLNSINQHYLEYRHKPLILVTSAEHYGALINLDFDYTSYLNAISQDGMNNTRIFSGTYVERPGDIAWMKSRNTLAPGPGKLIAPWPRSNVNGYAGGGNKFDLDHWDENYFIRLKDILSVAGSKSVMVELTLFGNQYKDSIWMNSPLYPDNNIQGDCPSGPNSFLLFETLKNKTLVLRQEAFVKKIVTELNAFDNVYYEICNEPHNDIIDTVAVNEWHVHMMQLIEATEAPLPKKHLIASNEVIINNPGISIVNYHYVRIPNMPGFDSLYSLNKVLSMDETVGSLIHSTINDVRLEAWDYIFKGGCIYNNLSWEYTTAVPKGTDSAKIIRVQLHHLLKFMSGINYLKMSPDKFAVINKPANAVVRTLSESGKQYAIYLHHSIQKGSKFIVGYEAIIKRFKDTLTLQIPAGTYDLQFVNPSRGNFIGAKKTFTHTGGAKTFVTPYFITDIAILLVKAKKKMNH